MCEVWGRGWGLLFSICLSSCSRLTYWKTDLSVSNHFGAFVKNLLTMYGSVFVLSLFCSFYVCLNSLSFYLPLNILQHIDWKAVHVPRSVLVGHSEVYLSLSYLHIPNHSLSPNCPLCFQKLSPFNPFSTLPAEW